MNRLAVLPRDIIADFSIQLIGIYVEEEVTSIANLALEHVLEMDRVQWATRTAPLTNDQSEKLTAILHQLVAGRPIQYILGVAHFYGMLLQVNESVLIPRQETEELVAWVVQANDLPAPIILDVCTGSGCIALSLAKSIPAAQVTGTDISAEALACATTNGNSQGIEVEFLQDDALNSDILLDKKFDILVSNPPYVCQSEKLSMARHVIEHEPALALFVSDEDALQFYRRILEQLDRSVNEGAWLYFEINERFGDALLTLMDELGFTEAELKHDISGRARMIRCKC